MAYYSFQGQYPIEGLPDRIRLPDGKVRTDSSSFTSQEIQEAGFILVPDPPAKQPNESLLWENNTWAVRDTRDLDEEKDSKLRALSLRRKQAEETFVFNGQTILLDEGTQARINAALIGLERSTEGTTTPWQIRRGVFVDFNTTTLEALGLAAFEHVRLCFVNAKAVSSRILAATSLADLDAIDLENGWPND